MYLSQSLAMASRPLLKRASSLPSDGLTLAHFTHRTQILSLYRQLVRSTRSLPTPEARKESLCFYRPEFILPFNPPPSNETMMEHVGRVRRLVQRVPWQGGAL
ncbi:hypothetical protein BDY24DRAFT_374257 [Mrakia frigida]|uniref:uncharacterized protein n=1 Tax=Mrakia frigida TaxID=29902 RepID=UPI003FCC10F0